MVETSFRIKNCERKKTNFWNKKLAKPTDPIPFFTGRIQDPLLDYDFIFILPLTLSSTRRGGWWIRFRSNLPSLGWFSTQRRTVISTISSAAFQCASTLTNFRCGTWRSSSLLRGRFGNWFGRIHAWFQRSNSVQHGFSFLFPRQRAEKNVAFFGGDLS